jgi:hypothetical protein
MELHYLLSAGLVLLKIGGFTEAFIFNCSGDLRGGNQWAFKAGLVPFFITNSCGCLSGHEKGVQEILESHL